MMSLSHFSLSLAEYKKSEWLNSRTGRSKGFVSVTFIGADEANRSLAGHGQLLKVLAIVVHIAKDK